MGWTVTAVFFAVYTVVSVLRNDRMLNAGYDLGIFEQAIRAYAHGKAPVVELKGPGFNLLGDHFHPILALVAPVYRLFPSAVTLLVVQAALMALACFPLTRWAHRAVGPATGLAVGCGLGASWGLVAGVTKDFHEICFAVPLLAFSVTALGQRRWWAAAAWSLPLLLVKEDLGLTLAAIGGYIAWQALRERHTPPPAKRRSPLLLGATLALIGAVGTAVEILVLLPAMNPRGGFDYWQQMPDQGPSPDSLAGLLSLGLHLFWPPMKWLLLFMLAAPTAFLGLRSPLTLLCVPTLAWRLLAGNEHYWQPNFHYNAILMPLVFAGLVDVLHRRPDIAPPLRRRKALAFSATFTAITVAVYPLHDLVLPSAWRTPAHVRTAERLLARIPDGATVASSNRLAPMLTGRTTVSLVCFGTGPDPAAPTALPATPPDWVVSDQHDPTVKTPCPVAQTHRMLRLYRAHGYTQVAEQDGITVLRRG
ncbi:DUF2079 domain-containing protein [Streptomyces angustmyceticus]|uniref:DUF2079 domain-containing protein n=3 Tax=Streptomyces angustmyceticus TaxID=285578 RepID=A0A5J4L9M1_9ACTN|nr:DUF2079 domain-containing protein [Streptomyces angustmyceticus]GES28511.1 hypothetical protein San01_09980 [Streptomyces angustmyceticus]